jgi:glycosyltransferase involved in cell wall biosynthesis
MPFYIRFIVNRLLKHAKLFWDFDDHILESKQTSRAAFMYLCEISTNIIVIHGYLKSIIPEEYWHKVILLPTTDGDMRMSGDKEKIGLKRKKTFEKEIRLVWVAISSNLPHVKRIIPILDKTAEDIKELYHKKLILTIVCNMPLMDKAEYLIVRNIAWTRYDAIQEMRNAHIGIMPLSDTVFAKGKGGFKLVQYISTGLPVLASEVGFNTEVVNETCGRLINDRDGLDEWKTGILKMTEKWDILSDLSNGAYQHWDDRFPFEKNYNIWKALLEVNE